jgi:hypothetical protein
MSETTAREVMDMYGNLFNDPEWLALPEEERLGMLKSAKYNPWRIFHWDDDRWEVMYGWGDPEKYRL